MNMPDYLWHPIFVHFSVALLTVATVFYVLASIFPKAGSRQQWITVAEWNLWVGFGLAVLTLLFGWLAFNTVSHDDASHEAMKVHAVLALITGGSFGVLTLWSIWHRKSAPYPSWTFIGLMLASFGFLVTTGLRGGELVYQHGLAVTSLPKVEMDHDQKRVAQLDPYAGQQQREIRALSPQQMQDYLDGKGMGLAKAAELNHFPGPAHVLELANQLRLTPEQRTKTQQLFTSMQRDAKRVGGALVEKERYLDRLFASGEIDKQKLSPLLEEIGRLSAELRRVHLQAHLEQKAILSPEQTALYDSLRGYTLNTTATQPSHAHKH